MGMLRGVHQVVLYVSDQAVARQFWTDVIGCTLVTDAEYGDERWLEVLTPDGHTRLVLAKAQPGFDRPAVRADLPHSNVFFYADDLEATHRELAAKGVTFPAPPVKQPWGWWAMFEDPEGTRFALRQD